MEPFEEPVWNVLQALAWGYLGDRAWVRELGGIRPDRDLWYVVQFGIAVRKAGRTGEGCPTLDKTIDELIRALSDRTVQAFGLRKGRGDLEAIPAEAWLDLRFFLHARRHKFSQPGLYAAPSEDSRFDATHWHQIRLRRDELMKLWPDRLAELVEDDDHGGEAVPKSAGAFTRCRTWLEGKMRASPKVRIKPKTAWREEAEAAFQVSTQQFNRAWKMAIEKTGAEAWSNPGRPRKSKSS